MVHLARRCNVTTLDGAMVTNSSSSSLKWTLWNIRCVVCSNDSDSGGAILKSQSSTNREREGDIPLIMLLCVPGKEEGCTFFPCTVLSLVFAAAWIGELFMQASPTAAHHCRRILWFWIRAEWRKGKRWIKYEIGLLWFHLLHYYFHFTASLLSAF